MIDASSPVPVKWQAETLLWLCHLPDQREDPDEAFDEWLDMAAEGDSTAIVWAESAWSHVRTLNTLARATLWLECQELLAKLSQLGHRHEEDLAAAPDAPIDSDGEVGGGAEDLTGI